MKFSAVDFVGGLPWTGMYDLDFRSDRIHWLDSRSPAAHKDMVVILCLSPVSLQLLQVTMQIFERFLQTPLSRGEPDLSYSEEKMTLSQDPRILRSCPRLYTDDENNTCWKYWGSGHRTRDKIACPFQSRGHPLACLLCKANPCLPGKIWESKQYMWLSVSMPRRSASQPLSNEGCLWLDSLKIPCENLLFASMYLSI